MAEPLHRCAGIRTGIGLSDARTTVPYNGFAIIWTGADYSVPGCSVAGYSVLGYSVAGYSVPGYSVAGCSVAPFPITGGPTNAPSLRGGGWKGKKCGVDQ